MLLSAIVVHVSAQSLADAARRSEEQRQQAPADAPSFTDRDLVTGRIAVGNREALTLVLTLPLLQQYFGARTALLRAMVHSLDLARQVLGATGRAGRGGVDALEHEYASIPAAVDAMRAAQMDVHSYTVTDAAFMIAVGVLAGKLTVPSGVGGTIAVNTAFLERHQQDIVIMSREATSLDSQLATSLRDATQHP